MIVSIASHSDFVSRIVIRESRVIGLWLDGHECGRVLFGFRWANILIIACL